MGGTGLLLAAVFIFGTAITVMWLARRFGVPDGLGGIMGAGTGVCGVSAIIATSPVVGAKPRDMAYAIGTILLFGTVMLFVMPYFGQALGVSEPQFGAWAAVAILNTAQLIAAAEWYGEEARNTAVLINAARIMLIPFIVIFAVWFYGLKNQGAQDGFWTTVRSKFPVFILGFFVLILLNSLHLAVLGGPGDRLAVLGHERGLQVVLRGRLRGHRAVDFDRRHEEGRRRGLSDRIRRGDRQDDYRADCGAADRHEAAAGLRW